MFALFLKPLSTFKILHSSSKEFCLHCFLPTPSLHHQETACWSWRSCRQASATAPCHIAVITALSHCTSVPTNIFLNHVIFFHLEFWFCYTDIFIIFKVYYTTAILLSGTWWINTIFSILDILLLVLTFLYISSISTVVPLLQKLLKELVAAFVSMKFHLWWTKLLQTLCEGKNVCNHILSFLVCETSHLNNQYFS